MPAFKRGYVGLAEISSTAFSGKGGQNLQAITVPYFNMKHCRDMPKKNSNIFVGSHDYGEREPF